VYLHEHLLKSVALGGIFRALILLKETLNNEHSFELQLAVGPYNLATQFAMLIEALQ
jgi:hypothetical protein